MTILRTLILLLFAALGSALHAQDGTGRLVAIGDLHGDHEAFRDIGQAAALIDADGRWIGGDATLVQLGDVTDRGPDSLKIIRDLQRLEEEAAEAGGKVVVLIGNHEAMNIIGDLRYVHPGEYEAFEDRRSKLRRKAYWRNNEVAFLEALQERYPEESAKRWRARWEEQHPLGWIEHRLAWQADGELAGWYGQKQAVAKIGDTIFVHGGISLPMAQQGIDALNARVAAAIADPTQAAILEQQDGPLWYRGNLPRYAGERTAEQIEQEMTDVLGLLDAERMVVAHTPRLEGIDTLHDGRLVRIDTGIADHYGGRASFLEITAGATFAVEMSEKGQWQRRQLAEPGEMP